MGASLPADAVTEGGPDTREQIFLAAERLFAERGFHGVSVRDIVASVGCNLAAINYHFGTKSELLLEIFRRRARELNKERQRLLREASAQGAPNVEVILTALLAPPILWRDPGSGHAVASRFLARAMTEATPQLREILESDVSHQRPFVIALKAALPGWSEADVCWTLHFVSGLAHQCVDLNFKRLRILSGGACDCENLPAVLDRAVRFALAGLPALQMRAFEPAERI